MREGLSDAVNCWTSSGHKVELVAWDGEKSVTCDTCSVSTCFKVSYHLLALCKHIYRMHYEIGQRSGETTDSLSNFVLHPIDMLTKGEKMVC